MKPEKGIRLGTFTLADMQKAGRLEPALRDYKWFYIGPEFCENLFSEAVCEETVFLQARGRKVCLLTPALSEKGVAGLDGIFRKLLHLKRRGRIDPAGLEITVNDFGAAELAARRRLPFRLNAGRLLYGNFFGDEADRYSLKTHNSLMIEFFRSLGISRVELSTAGRRENGPRPGNPSGVSPRQFRVTMYYPYMNLTSTRTCLVGMPPVPPEEAARGVACGRECLICSFEMAHPWIKERLTIRGNTVFMNFPEKAYKSEKELAELNVDRLIYCPFP